MRKVKKLSKGDVFFAAFLLLLLIPQTRKPILVGVNKVKVWAMAPSLEPLENQIQLTAFEYYLKDLDGGDKQISVGKNRIVFVSYWATWCPPCIAELPSIQKLYESYGNTVDFALITKEEPKVVSKFLKERGWDLPVYNALMKTPSKLNDKQLPTSYLIDGNGKVLIQETGASDWNALKIRQVLDGLLLAEITKF